MWSELYLFLSNRNKNVDTFESRNTFSNFIIGTEYFDRSDIIVCLNTEEAPQMNIFIRKKTMSHAIPMHKGTFSINTFKLQSFL